MVFESFPYQRPDLEAFTRQFEDLLGRFQAAAGAEDQDTCFARLDEMRVDLATQYNLCHIRHTMDTGDAFYEQENDFFDGIMPHFQALVNRLYQALLESPFREKLEQRWGRQIFNIANLSLKTFRPEVLTDLQEENRLSSEYVKLKAAARLQFRGEEHNLSSIQRLEVSPDRATRREASETKWAFFAGHAERTGDIYHQLVQTRDRIAKGLGFDNFVRLGYARLLRSDYGPEEVAAFRAAILKHVVPVASGLYERQRKRLGIGQLFFFDEDFRYPTGNPEPKGNPAWIIDNAGRMYSELSAETHQFFEFMRGSHLMDLETRPGKATGGYCTYLGKYQAPFIFSNFNGTSGDIDVLTHEAGHAFQVYASRETPITDYHWPTLEACEIHSMSMEFFTWPWMHLFFGADTDKYHFAHLTNALYFMPYGVAVDEFQHYVYENPGASPEERNAAWRRIEQKYLPHRRYDGHAFLESGGFWHKQSHVFTTPFYYIDYVLAQICALQFWRRSQEDRQSAWSDYVRLCRAGGSRSFLDLVSLAGLESPFREDTVAAAVTAASEWLAQVDDSRF